jgi:hypothetical protein
VQSWPVLQIAAKLALAVTNSRSASSKTSTGALPPSSRCTRLSVFAAVAMIFLPVPVEPVRLTMRTSGCSTSAWPVSLPPVTMLTTPSGMPASWNRSASMSAERGVVGAGLSTTVQPAASAGPSFHTAISSG